MQENVLIDFELQTSSKGSLITADEIFIPSYRYFCNLKDLSLKLNKIMKLNKD